MYYVYRFLNKDRNIIYVGKTINLKTRLFNHINNGHLPADCYKQVEWVEYIDLASRVEMDIAELYFINLFKPYFNALDKENQPLTLELKGKFNWEPFTQVDFKTSYTYKTTADQLKQENQELSAKCSKLLKIDESCFKRIRDPYFMKQASAKLNYISKVIGKKIGIISNIKGKFNFQEVIVLLQDYHDLVFYSVNRGTQLKVTLVLEENQSPTVKVSDFNHSLVNSNPTCCFSLTQPNYTDKYLNNNFILEGVAPLLYYQISEAESSWKNFTC